MKTQVTKLIMIDKVAGELKSIEKISEDKTEVIEVTIPNKTQQTSASADKNTIAIILDTKSNVKL